MSYSEFTLERVVKTFNLTLSEQVNLFADIPEVECSSFLTQTLEYNFLSLWQLAQKKPVLS